MSQLMTQSNFSPIMERLQSLGMDKVTIDREISFALQHINKSPQLLSCTPESKLKAVVNIALVGLTLNPVAKESYIVPRWNRQLGANECCLEPSYVGLVKLLTDAGSVVSMIANVVYEGDNFEIDLANNQNPIRHIRCLVSSRKGQIIGCYALATLPNGIKQPEWMDIEELYAVRERSESYLAHKAGKMKSCVWVSDEAEMMRKTVIRRIYKYLPRTERMQQVDEAVALDNSDYAITHQQYGYIEGLLGSSTLDDSMRADIMMEMDTMSASRAGEVIEMLKANQIDPVTQSGRYSQKELINHLGKIK